MNAQQFRRWRKSLGYSQPRAAEEIGRSTNQICNYETGRAEVPKVVRLACGFLAQVGKSDYHGPRGRVRE